MGRTPTLLVTPTQLSDQLVSGIRPSVLDVRWRLGGPPARADYDAGHIPGSVFVDLDLDLAAPPGEGRHPLPSIEAFGRFLRRAGIRGDRPVVCYDERDGTSAARAWWLLTYFGHPATAVLDGGLAGWVANGGRLTQDQPDPGLGDFVPVPGRLWVVDAHEAAALARSGVLLDARSESRYRGESEPVDPVAGHIPGALSAPTAANVDGDGRFWPADRLADRFRALGVDGTRPTAVYCGSGVTAAHEILALKLAGVDAALYPGSWSAWITRPDREVATGADPG